MTNLETAQFILSKDNFSQWLGVNFIEIRENYCLIEMLIREEMINGLGSVHGGVSFAFADSALAFSANNSGNAAVALNCVISFTKAVKLGDRLRAESVLISDTKKTAVYDVSVKNQNDELVAAFRGTAYKIGKKVSDLELLK